MSSERVISKHLFNYTLSGEVDDEVKKMEKMMQKMPDPEIMDLMKKHNSDDPNVDYHEVAPRLIRKMMAAVNQVFEAGFKESAEKCDHYDFKVFRSVYIS